MVIALGIHLFPFRTEKLSPTTSMVLRKSGRVDSRRFSKRELKDRKEFIRKSGFLFPFYTNPFFTSGTSMLLFVMYGCSGCCDYKDSLCLITRLDNAKNALKSFILLLFSRRYWNQLLINSILNSCVHDTTRPLRENKWKIKDEIFGLYVVKHYFCTRIQERTAHEKWWKR